MRVFVVSIIALMIGNTSLSQGCCSGGGGSPMAGGAAAGVLQEGQLQLLSSYKYSRSNHFLSGDLDTVPFFDNLSSNYLFFKADYGITSKLTLSVASGYYFNRTITEFADTTTVGSETHIERKKVGSSGFGDLIIFPRYSVYEKNKKSVHSELSLGLGLKIPLGSHQDSNFIGYKNFINDTDPQNIFIDSAENWLTSPPTVQTTTGTHDFMFYAFYLKDFHKKNLKVFTSALYIRKGWNSLGMKFGDYATVGLFAGTSVFKNRLSLLGQLKGEWVGRMKSHDDLDILSLYSIDQESTGSMMLSFVPQVTYIIKKPQIALFATADIPMYQYMRGTQIGTQVQITGGISYRFFVKKSKSEDHIEEGPVVYNEEFFHVSGKCGMCKETIENTLKAMGGVSVADWSEETHMLKVRFDSLKLSLDDLKVELARVGYDTESYKATDSAYEALHSCCKYERE
jgi:periplasmic mercuric ion binding protein